MREFDAGDADGLFDLRRDAVAQRYNDEPMSRKAQAIELIDSMASGFAAGRSIHWAVVERSSDRLIGLFGINDWNSHHRRASVGYNLSRDEWGRGLASEALDAVVRFAFTVLGAHRIEAETIVDNTASVRLLERLGFVCEGVRRDYSLEDDGQFHDSAFYALLDATYRRRGQP
ncbi:MAG: hypothetical protein RL499_1045 [Actinomycetota bacterium]